MKGNAKFTICPIGGAYKVIAAYGQQETTWVGFKTPVEAGERILTACKNLQAEKEETKTYGKNIKKRSIVVTGRNAHS